ncbi:GntR family transcriptional regulator [Candidatus Bipolaricaulota bacterium]|nr:GntR family transcriptional regulator [Candidatus Bipolaricaulota bacterium]
MADDDTKITSVTKKNMAIEELKKAILTGELEPGNPIREEKYSELLDVSRGTLRGALNSLEDQGFIDSFANQGAFVTNLNKTKVQELYDLRKLLETHALQIGLENNCYDNLSIKKMQHAVQKMGDYEEEEEFLNVIRSDISFHDLLCSEVNHDLLSKLFNTLVTLSKLCMARLKVNDLEIIRDEAQHREILDAIRTKDFSSAKDLLQSHLNDARDHLLEHIGK